MCIFCAIANNIFTDKNDNILKEGLKFMLDDYENTCLQQTVIDIDSEENNNSELEDPEYTERSPLIPRA